MPVIIIRSVITRRLHYLSMQYKLAIVIVQYHGIFCIFALHMTDMKSTLKLVCDAELFIPPRSWTEQNLTPAPPNCYYARR